MATEPIGFIPSPRTKRDSELANRPPEQKVDPQATIFIQAVAIVLLLVVMVMVLRRIPIIPLA